MKLFFKNIYLCFCLISIILFSTSCSKKSVEIPKDVLSKEQLIPVLVDIHLAQSAMGINQLTDTSRFSMNDYSAYIFTTHHITKKQYDKSMGFYTLHPELLDGIYQEVINELSKKQGESEAK